MTLDFLVSFYDRSALNVAHGLSRLPYSEGIGGAFSGLVRQISFGTGNLFYTRPVILAGMVVQRFYPQAYPGTAFQRWVETAKTVKSFTGAIDVITLLPTVVNTLTTRTDSKTTFATIRQTHPANWVKPKNLPSQHGVTVEKGHSIVRVEITPLAEVGKKLRVLAFWVGALGDAMTELRNYCPLALRLVQFVEIAQVGAGLYSSLYGLYQEGKFFAHLAPVGPTVTVAKVRYLFQVVLNGAFFVLSFSKGVQMYTGVRPSGWMEITQFYSLVAATAIPLFEKIAAPYDAA